MSRTQSLVLIFIVALVFFIVLLKPPSQSEGTQASTTPALAPALTRSASAVAVGANYKNIKDDTATTPAQSLPNNPQAGSTNVSSLAQRVEQIKQTDQLGGDYLIELMQVNSNLNQELASVFLEKSPDSIEIELAASASFAKFQQKKEQFKQLQLETLQCNIDICLLSIAGLELLTPAARAQLEEVILSDRDSGLIQKLPKGSGGSSGEFITNDGHFYRVVYPINPRFAMKGIQG